MLTRLERALWRATVPSEVRTRHGDLTKDFTNLIAISAFPKSPHEVLDVGSGSGAGSIALRDVYPLSQITAIDSADTWQEALYRRRKPPSDVTFLPVKIEDFANSRQTNFDLAIAARISIGVAFSSIDPWAKKAEFYANEMLTIASILHEHGTLALSWPKTDRLTFYRIICDNLRMDCLFSTNQFFEGVTDNWIVWSDLNRQTLEQFMSKPELFLTSFAKKTFDLDPYGLYDEF
jgi:hypothetical protein